MNDTLFAAIGVLSITAFVLANLFQSPQPPQVIYVQVAESEPRGVGCLPLLVIVIIILIFLYLSASV